MISFKLTGADSVNNEYKAFNTNVYRAMQAGLTAVGSELTKQLQKHVQSDVYDMYSPKAYKRRLDDGGLIDSRYMKTSQRSMSVELSYTPKGYNPNYPFNINKNGDELINTIENSLYTWSGTDDIPERHFWNNFVEEAVGENGWAETVLVDTMNKTQRDLAVVKDGRIQQDGNDTVFEQQMSMSDSDLSSGNDDLPF